MPEVLVGRQQKSEVKEGADPSEPVKVPKKEFDVLTHDSEVKTDKEQQGKNRDNNRGGKGGGGKGEPTSTEPEQDNRDSYIPPINSTPGITTAPIIQPPPSTTKVNIKIK